MKEGHHVWCSLWLCFNLLHLGVVLVCVSIELSYPPLKEAECRRQSFHFLSQTGWILHVQVCWVWFEDVGGFRQHTGLA